MFKLFFLVSEFLTFGTLLLAPGALVDGCCCDRIRTRRCSFAGGRCAWEEAQLNETIAVGHSFVVTACTSLQTVKTKTTGCSIEFKPANSTSTIDAGGTVVPDASPPPALPTFPPNIHTRAHTHAHTHLRTRLLVLSSGLLLHARYRCHAICLPGTLCRG